MLKLNRQRLKTARVLGGYSLRQLEYLMAKKVSYNAISKYEKGLMQPEPAVLLKLAEVLNVSPSWLCAPDEFPELKIVFPSRPKLSKAQRDIITQNVQLTIQRIKEVERLLSIDTVFSNPLAGKKIKDAFTSEAWADRLRETWQLGTGPIQHIADILESHGIYIIEADLPEGIESMGIKADPEMPIIIVSPTLSNEQKRLGILKKLGKLLISANHVSDSDSSTFYEEFARAMILPAHEVLQRLGISRTRISPSELNEISADFGISVSELLKRIKEMGLMRPTHFQKLSRQTSQSIVEEEITGYSVNEKNIRLQRLISRLLAEGLIDEGKAASLAGLPLRAFRSLYTGVSEDELSKANDISAFNKAWGADEPDYSDEDLLTINPVYEGR